MDRWHQAAALGDLRVVTAEEQGLLGSEYLGQHPPVPPGEIALDINYDMILPIGIPSRSTSTARSGPTSSQSSRPPRNASISRSFPTPGRRRTYYRSDHFSLSRVGIPAFSIDAGMLYEGHDEAWGKAKFEAFEEHDYHNFSDNYHADWDFAGNAKLDRFGMELGWEAVAAPRTISWKPGDEFEAARKASPGTSKSRRS